MKKTALITGGSRGIGLGIATCLAREGYDLAICGVRELNAGKAVWSSLQTLGREVVYCQADIGRTPDRERLVQTVKDHFGQLNLLVNNAGIAPRERRDLLETTEDSFDEVLQTNLKGPYFLTQAVARWLVDQKQAQAGFTGCIIFVTSISATVASVNRGEYCISKSGLSMASQLWAVRLAEYQIPVYEIRPGLVQTDMTAAVRTKYDRLIADGLLLQRRWGRPEDVGRAVGMLARGDLAYSTGQVINVDGGHFVQRL